MAEDEIVHKSRQNSEDSQRSAQEARRDAHIRELEDEVERYRRAAEDALSQLDWCIGYMHGSGKRGLAKSLSRNRGYFRTHLMKRAEQPVPSQETDQ